MADKLINIPNDVTQTYHCCRLKLVVETFEHSTKPTNQNSLKFPKLRIKNVIIKLWGLVK